MRWITCYPRVAAAPYHLLLKTLTGHLLRPLLSLVHSQQFCRTKIHGRAWVLVFVILNSKNTREILPIVIHYEIVSYSSKIKLHFIHKFEAINSPVVKTLARFFSWATFLTMISSQIRHTIYFFLGHRDANLIYTYPQDEKKIKQQRHKNNESNLTEIITIL